MFKYLIFIAMISTLMACGSNSKQDSVIPKATYPISTTLSLSQFAQTLKSKEACEAYEGNWKKVGKLQRYACILPTTDAGNVCRDNDQCQVACISNNRNLKIGESVIGQCHDSTHLFGCRAYVSDGKAEPILCID